MDLPAEIARREDRLAVIAAAKAKIEARASERSAREQAESEAKMAKRQAKQAATGKKPGGKPPKPPAAGPRSEDQANLADEDSRIIQVTGGGFEQCYNAQAVVDTESMLIANRQLTINNVGHAQPAIRANRRCGHRSGAHRGRDRGPFMPQECGLNINNLCSNSHLFYIPYINGQPCLIRGAWTGVCQASCPSARKIRAALALPRVTPML